MYSIFYLFKFNALQQWNSTFSKPVYTKLLKYEFCAHYTTKSVNYYLKILVFTYF